MAWSLVQPRRLVSLNLVLITVLLYLAVSVSPLAADALNKQIDHDLFLDDEGSGRCATPVGSGDRAIGDDECEPEIRKADDKGRHSNVDTTTTKAVWPAVTDKDSSGAEGAGSSIFGPGPGNFFSQPGILAAIICGAIVGLLCAILLVMFIVYRMRKKDEGSYVLDDSKRVAPTYGKSKEFYA